MDTSSALHMQGNSTICKTIQNIISVRHNFLIAFHLISCSSCFVGLGAFGFIFSTFSSAAAISNHTDTEWRLVSKCIFLHSILLQIIQTFGKWINLTVKWWIHEYAMHMSIDRKQKDICLATHTHTDMLTQVNKANGHNSIRKWVIKVCADTNKENVIHCCASLRQPVRWVSALHQAD